MSNKMRTRLAEARMSGFGEKSWRVKRVVSAAEEAKRVTNREMALGSVRATFTKAVEVGRLEKHIRVCYVGLR